MLQLESGAEDTSEEKTIILWGKDDVLTRAVENLLVTRSGWRLIRVSDELEEASLTRTLAQIIPDVLIVHESAFCSDIHSLIKIVQDYSKLRIITIGLENNQMEIYNKKRFYIKEASDLMTAIQNGTIAES